MARRKSKKPPQDEDTSILLDSCVPVPPKPKRKINSLASPVLLFIVIFTVGACIMGWFCVQQQSSLDQLSESFTTMEKRIANLQQVMEMTEEQIDTDVGVEERIFALEVAQKQAQDRAEVALTTSQKLNSGLHSQILDLHNEMDTRLAEIKQVSLSITTLQSMFKNQSEEFEVIKESVVAGLSSSSALAENVAGLTKAVARALTRVDEHFASMEAVNAQLEGQASELSGLKESMQLHNAALHTNNKETAAIKELIEATQAARAQALQEMLSSVQMTLDEQFFTSQTLHSSVMAQLQTFYSQLANAPLSMKMKSSEEAPAAEDKIQEEQPLGQEVVVTGEQEEEVVPEEKEEEEIKPEEQEDGEIVGHTEEQEAEEEMQQDQPLEEGITGEQEEDEIEEEVVEETPPEEQEDEENTEEQEEEEITGEAEDEEEEEEIAPEEQEDQEIVDEQEDEEIRDEEEEEEITEEPEDEEEEEEIASEEQEDQEIVDEQEEEESTEEEEETAPEEEDEEIAGQSEEEEFAGETEEEEEAEETVDAEEESEEAEDIWDTDEEAAELNSDDFMDEIEEEE